MRFAFFGGCKIPYYLAHYGVASRAVLLAMGVELQEIEFNCCGNAVRNQDVEAYLLLAARNLALAEARGVSILTPCKCCFGNLSQAAHVLTHDSRTRKRINARLAAEGLSWTGRWPVRHLLQVLAQEIGPQKLGRRVKRRFKGLKVAAHYGCHALRPSRVTKFDNPLAPTLFENLIHLTGAECVDWQRRLECCGHPVADLNPTLATHLSAQKMADAAASGADCVCVACTHCQFQFDRNPQEGRSHGLPSILFPQLLGLSMCLPPKQVGIQHSQAGLSVVTDRLA